MNSPRRSAVPGQAPDEIVTSRMRLTEIPGAHVFDVDLLEPDEAIQLLSNVVGRRRRWGAAHRVVVPLIGAEKLAT